MSEATAATKQWLELAVRDSQSAKHLLTLYPQPLEVIAYLCEQSAEKMLKAYLCANGQDIPRTHDFRYVPKWNTPTPINKSAT